MFLIMYTIRMTVNDPRVKEQIIEMCRVLAYTDDKDLLESFFYCLLTPAETADIASRWALVKALREGKTQREIGKNLGVSLCKITRGSRCDFFSSRAFTCSSTSASFASSS